MSEVEPTEEEWFEAIKFLTRTGQISSDTLGVSMLVIGINHPAGGATESGEAVEVVGDGHRSAATEATVFGQFYVEGAPRYQNGDDIANGAPGEPCFIEGRVFSVNGEPIPTRTSRSGRPTTKASTTCSASAWKWRRAAASSTPTSRGGAGSGR